MVAGRDDHEAGGMNVGNAAAATAAVGSSGVLIAVRFTTADMSAKHTPQTNNCRPLTNINETEVKTDNTPLSQYRSA